MTRFFGPFVPLSLGLLCAGCPRPEVARPYPPPTADVLLHHLATHALEIKSMRTEAKVDYKTEHDRVKVTTTFLVEKPDRLRIEMEATFVGAVASLASDGHDFQLLDVRDNRFLTGAASPCNIARLIRIELSTSDIIAVLEGGAPLLEGARAEVGWDSKNGGREVLTLRAPSGEVETLKLAAMQQSWDLVSAELRASDGKVVWHIEHEDYADAGGGIRLPGKSAVAQPARSADAHLRYKNRELNPSLPPTAFHLSPPTGIPAEPVSCP